MSEPTSRMSDVNSNEPQSPSEFWEDRYQSAEQIWSGKVNRVLEEVAGSLPPGTALDLGCGEGGDVVWLARRGWVVTGIDISPTAVERAAAAADAAGVGGRVEFVAADLTTLPAGRYDLVTASFLHAPVGVELPRIAILKQAAERVAAGGHLLVTGHAAFPPWADVPAHEHEFASPQEEIELLGLGDHWEVLAAELRPREATSPSGEQTTLEDAVILLRRRH